MKKIICYSLCLFLLSLGSTSILAQRTGKMLIQGTECEYDTLTYRHVAPGATYLVTQFKAIKSGTMTYKMRSHLIAVDLTNPYNNFSPYMAKDNYYALNKQSDEVKRQKAEGKKPVATLNSCGFAMYKGTTVDQYELQDNMIINNEVRYGVSNSTLNWYIDQLGKGLLRNVSMDAIVTNGAGEKWAIGQINHFRDHAAASNKLALFCNRIPKTRAADGSTGVDVILTKVDGGSVVIGSNKMVVKQLVEGCNHTLASNEAALSGVGDTEAYLRALQVGEEITIDVNYVDKDGNAADPTAMCTSFRSPSIIEGQRIGEGAKYIASSVVGLSQDGNTVYLCNLEMNSMSNASENCFIDYLINMGVWDGMVLDGGVSAEMTVDGNFVSVNTLTGRYIPAGFVLHSIAPDDSELASVECAELSKVTLNVGESQAISLYGFNQYGEMIDNNATKNANIEFTCTPALGTFSDGTFTATKWGVGTINVSIKDKGTVLQIPVNTTGTNPDVNGDGKIDIKDVNAVLTVMMGGDTTGIDTKAADVDQDGDVDVRDLSIIIELMKDLPAD